MNQQLPAGAPQSPRIVAKVGLAAAICRSMGRHCAGAGSEELSFCAFCFFSFFFFFSPFKVGILFDSQGFFLIFCCCSYKQSHAGDFG